MELACWLRRLRLVGETEIVHAAVDELGAGHRLRHPPHAADDAVVAALHVPGNDVQNEWRDLADGIYRRRMCKRAHKRIVLNGPVRDGNARRIGVECFRTTNHGRQGQPAFARRLTREGNSPPKTSSRAIFERAPRSFSLEGSAAAYSTTR